MSFTPGPAPGLERLPGNKVPATAVSIHRGLGENLLHEHEPELAAGLRPSDLGEKGQ